MSPFLLLAGAGALAAVGLLVWATLRVPLLTVALLLVALPWGLTPLGTVKLVQALSIVAAGAAALSALAGAGRPLARTGPLLWATAMVAAAFASVFPATTTGDALKVSFTYAIGLALAWSVAWLCRDWGSVRLVVTLACVAGAVVCVMAMQSASKLRVADAGNVVSGRATGVFAQPNELGSFAAMVMVLALAGVVANRHRWLRVVSALAAVAGLVGLVLSLSRAAWIGAVLGVVVLLVVLPRLRRPLGITVGAVALLGVLESALAGTSSPVLRVVLDRLQSITNPNNPYDARPQIWAEALRQMTVHPWLGVGPGGFPATARRVGSRIQGLPADHAHDFALTVASEQGLLGLVLLVGVLVTAAVAVTRELRELRAAGPQAAPERSLVAGLLAALTTVLGQGLLDFPLRNSILASMVWLLFGLLLAAVNLPAPGGRPGPAARARPASPDREPLLAALHGSAG